MTRPSLLEKLLSRRAIAEPYRHVAHYERVLGTYLEFTAIRPTQGEAFDAEARALAEIDRLEAIFNRYRTDSELSRWEARPREEDIVSPELAEVLALAEAWRERTRGAFHPAVEALVRCWQAASPVAPHLLEEMCGPLWKVEGQRAQRLTSLPANLNAIAKGYIIDRACVAASEEGGDTVVNIGGDLRHIGTTPVLASITNPFDKGENSPPLARVRIQNAALATSGNYHRGFRLGDRHFSHILDPRTGQPADDVVSASVVTDSALEADVLATAFSVFSPAESLTFVQDLPRVGCLIVDRDGREYSNARWDALTLAP
jgi:thiamine biosynthesis lipoprotein